jgi:hypothetical protein
MAGKFMKRKGFERYWSYPNPGAILTPRTGLLSL